MIQHRRSNHTEWDSQLDKSRPNAKLNDNQQFSTFITYSFLNCWHLLFILRHDQHINTQTQRRTPTRYTRFLTTNVDRNTRLHVNTENGLVHMHIEQYVRLKSKRLSTIWQPLFDWSVFVSILSYGLIFRDANIHYSIYRLFSANFVLCILLSSRWILSTDWYLCCPTWTGKHQNIINDKKKTTINNNHDHLW